MSVRRTWIAVHEEFFRDIGELLVLDILRYDRLTVEGTHERDGHMWYLFSTEGRIEVGRLESFGLREPQLERPGSLLVLGEHASRHGAYHRLDGRIKTVREARASMKELEHRKGTREAQRKVNTGRCTAPSATN